jgi:hypothetical protein
MRIYAVSDLHADFKANRLLVEEVSSVEYRRDALLVAGDIADRLETIEETLSLLCSKFSKLFYMPGNHELWVRGVDYDSLEKLSRVIEICDRLGVQTRPARAGRLWIVPLYSWYEAAFDADESADVEELEAWADFYFCRWPESIKSVSDYFIELNAQRIKNYDGPVISLSHFLPRRDLLPETTDLKFKGLPRVSGSERLEEQIRELNSIAHVFGHSHINRDVMLDGVRYVQNALRYPAERKDAPFSFKQVWPLAEPDAET